MCLGIPVRVISNSPGYAICDRDGEEVTIDMKLVGEQPAGTWVLCFLDAAREVIDEQKAMEISDALRAITVTFNGSSDVDHLFPDLVDREPQLPEHLRAQAGQNNSQKNG